MDTLHSIENLPTEDTETDDFSKEEPLNFRFMARNVSIDWRSVSLIDIDRIAQTMDIAALQEHMELVTFANLDEIFDLDPLFVKLFKVAQYTIEYLLHSQDYLKNSIAKEQRKVRQENRKFKEANLEIEKLKKNIIELKKENKKRRRIVEEQQRMMEVGANSFYKCPICPKKTFMNATYLQGHLVRKHPEHVSYVGDAVAHTKLVTQDLEAQMVTVKSKIEEEKQKAEELQRKNEQLAAQAKRELEEKQAEIQENERKRYETKLRQLEETFKQDITKLESNETLYQKRIAELETKTNYHEKKNESIGNMVTELKHEKDEYETTFTQRLSTMETQLRERQRKEEEKALSRAQKPKKVVSKLSFADPPKNVKSKIDEEEEMRRLIQEIAAQHRPAVQALFEQQLRNLGIQPTQQGLTDGMFKLKMEDLRNNRSQKVASRPSFYDHRMKIETELTKRSSTNLSLRNRPKSPKTKRAPARPIVKPHRAPKNTALVESASQNRSLPITKPSWSEVPEKSPGKPALASTLKASNPPIESSIESSGWEPVNDPPKVMRSYKEVVADSNDLEPITDRTEPVSDKTEPIESSVWDSVSEKDEVVSIGADVKRKAQSIENQLKKRKSSGNKPLGGVDISGGDRTQMAIDDLLSDSETGNSQET